MALLLAVLVSGCADYAYAPAPAYAYAPQQQQSFGPFGGGGWGGSRGW